MRRGTFGARLDARALDMRAESGGRRLPDRTPGECLWHGGLVRLQRVLLHDDAHAIADVGARVELGGERSELDRLAERIDRERLRLRRTVAARTAQRVAL